MKVGGVRHLGPVMSDRSAGMAPSRVTAILGPTNTGKTHLAVERMLGHWGYPPITGKVPYWLAYSVASVAEFWDTLKGGTLNNENGLTRFSIQYMATDHYYSIAKIEKDLGWRPKVNLQESIRRTAQGVRAAGNYK